MTSAASSASSSDSALTLRVTSPEDLIAVAPLLLGFHPADSVVMLTSDGARPFHARSDLPAPGESADNVDAVAAQLVRAAHRNGVRAVALVVFSADPGVARRTWGALRRHAARARLRIVDAFRADGRRYYPFLGDRRLRENGIAYDVSSHPFLVEAVVRGMVVQPDRSALVASIAPRETERRAVVRALEAAGLGTAAAPATDGERRRWGGRVREVVAAHVASGTVGTDAEVAEIAWALQDERVRDAAWSLVAGRGAAAHQAFWADVVRRTPDRLVPAPAALLAWAAWRAGHGALAWIAVDRCLAVDPAYRVAELLAHCLQEAIPPDVIESGFVWDEGLPE